MEIVNEEWRAVEGFPNYQVSNFGGVRSIDHVGKTKAGGLRLFHGKQLKPASDGNGYLQVTVSNEQRAITKKVHSLVARAFLGMRPPGKEINHKDGNKDNCRAANLEWVTASENIKHAFANGLSHAHKGEAHWAAKLTAIQVDEIRRRYANGNISQRNLGTEYGISQSHIHLIVTRKLWPHVA
jgi:hypothetical protein